MWTEDTPDLAVARLHLASLGYVVHVRAGGFFECLVSGGPERWFGRGATEDDALIDALRCMYPSRASRAARPSQVAEPARVVAPPDPPAAAQPTMAAEGPQPASEARTQVELPSVHEASPPSETLAYVAVPVVEATPRATLDVDTALGEVNDLLIVVESHRQELALMSRERQRLQLLGWICHARALQDASGRYPRVVGLVTEVARRLGGLAKLWWPGSVNALQVDAAPADVGKELNVPPRDRALLTWATAAELAEQRLREVEERDEAAGLDEYGWADAARLEPAPLGPADRLSELRRFVERVAGPVDKAPPPVTDDIRRPAGELRDSLMRWARLGRWLRASPIDFALWGATMGRIRWLAAASQSAPLLQLVDERYSPVRSWAADLREDPEAKRQQQVRKTLVKNRPQPGAPDDAVRAWVMEALGVLPPERILNHMRDHRELVLGLTVDTVDERRQRRHLKRLQELLGGPPAVMDASDVTPTMDGLPVVDYEDEGDSGGPTRDQELLSAVRPHTEGLAALFVSNREDPTLRNRLATAFGFSLLDWSDGTPRRLQEVEARIVGGKYQLVLGATGFQSHSMDALLMRACRRAHVRYVRVHRGRQLACVLGLARELGIAPDGVAGSAA